MADNSDATFRTVFLALTEFPEIADIFLEMIKEILEKPEASPEDGADLGRVIEGFQADIELAKSGSRSAMAYVQAAAEMKKGPLQ